MAEPPPPSPAPAAGTAGAPPRAEEQLHLAEQRLAAHVENTPLVVIEWDREVRVARWNAQAERVFGWAAAEVIGKGLFEWPFVLEENVEMARRMVTAGQSGREPRSVVTTANRTKSGAIVWCEWHNSLLYDDAGRLISALSLGLDVTERKRITDERETLNRQLQDAQRWESLGVLAGGVAHDFNNILTVVLGSAGLARRGLPPGSPAVGYLDQIEQACRRAADVCRQMLAYAGRAHGAGTRTHLAALVRESVPLLEIPAARTAVQFDLDDRLPPIQADPTQVRQVLVNLVTNAAEAAHGHFGPITVRTHAAEVPEGASDAGFPLAPPPGRYVVLTVSDTGCGMTPDVRGRMFDPFYTTKFAGRGLGLAAVLGIVRTHKGGIRVATAPDQGTTVSVYWRAALDPAPATPIRRARPAASALVIDDEIFVREVAASTLEELGFAPLLAADGPSGLELYRRYRDAIKLAVIDVVLPGMMGDQVLAALRAVDPNLPVVLISGFADRRVLRVSSGPHTEFLQKPFHPEDLMAAVQRLV